MLRIISTVTSGDTFVEFFFQKRRSVENVMDMYNINLESPAGCQLASAKAPCLTCLSPVGGFNPSPTLNI